MDTVITSGAVNSQDTTGQKQAPAVLAGGLFAAGAVGAMLLGAMPLAGWLSLATVLALGVAIVTGGGRSVIEDFHGEKRKYEDRSSELEVSYEAWRGLLRLAGIKATGSSGPVDCTNLHSDTGDGVVSGSLERRLYLPAGEAGGPAPTLVEWHRTADRSVSAERGAVVLTEWFQSVDGIHQQAIHRLERTASGGIRRTVIKSGDETGSIEHSGYEPEVMKRFDLIDQEIRCHEAHIMGVHGRVAGKVGPVVYNTAEALEQAGFIGLILGAVAIGTGMFGIGAAMLAVSAGAVWSGEETRQSFSWADREVLSRRLKKEKGSQSWEEHIMHQIYGKESGAVHEK